MLHVLCSDFLESSLHTVIEKHCLWSHYSCVMQSCDCLITHSDKKSSNCTINNNNDDDVVAEISVRREENSRENIIRKENKDRRDRKENEILFSSLKETEKEENVILINKEICWDNSTDSESINWL